VKGWRAIQSWEDTIASRGIRNTSHVGIIHTFTKRGGIGNRVMQIMVASVIAMLTGRKVCPFDGGRHEFEYPPTVESARDCPLASLHFDIPRNGDFFNINFSNYRNNHLHLPGVSLSSLVYLHRDLAKFCRGAFGIHAQYFLINYIMRIPQRYREKCKALTDGVPATIRLFGLHLRFQYADNFYSRGMKETLAVAMPFCLDQLAHRPTTFVLATDNEQLFAAVSQRIRILAAPIQRVADGQDDSALTDIVMLMLCEEWLLTWRSTYSALISLRMGRRAWVVEKYTNEVYLMSHSQVMHSQTPLYIRMVNWKPFDLNSIGNIGQEGQVEALRYYYRWCVL
jgi:hypothetical protein